MPEFSYVELVEVLVLVLAHESRKTRDGDGTPGAQVSNDLCSRSSLQSQGGIIVNVAQKNITSAKINLRNYSSSAVFPITQSLMRRLCEHLIFPACEEGYWRR